MYVGQNYEEVAGKVLDMTGFEMELSKVELESGEVYVGQNNCEDVAGRV
jgi:hypothetical protein